MKIVRRIPGEALMDTERNENIRRTCSTDKINVWVLDRKIKWNEHMDRMTDERIVKITRDRLPEGRRSLGRPIKRWNDYLPNY